MTSEESRSPVRRAFGKLADYALYIGIAVLLAALVFRKPSGPKEGSAAAAFELPRADGAGKVSLEQFRGRPVLLEVFASWCGVCERAAPMLAAEYRERSASGVAFVAVSVDDSQQAALRAQRQWRIPYDVVIDDGTVSRAYSVSLLPTFVLIDAEGRVRRVTSGMPSERTLSRWFAEL